MTDSESKALVADGVEVPLDPAAQRAQENIGRRIIAGGAWRSVAYATSTVIAVVATSIISRAIGPEGFAEFTTALSLITVAMLISDFGLLALGLREYAALVGEARERAFRAMITMRFAFGLVAGLAIVAFSVAVGYSEGLVIGLCFAALAVPVQSLASSYGVPLQASFRLNVMAALDVFRQATVSGLMIAAALVTGSVGVIIAANLPVAVALAIVTGVLIRKQASLWPSLDFETMRGLLRDVGTFAVAASLGTMYPFISQIVSDSTLAADESGQFALAFRVYAVLLAGWLVVASSAFPLLVTSSREDIDRMVFATRRLIQASFLVGVGCTVGLVCGADFVVAALGGDEYAGSTELIAIISLALPATFTLVTGNSVLLASGRHRELVTVSAIGASVSVALTWFAAERWGGVGAAGGIVAGEALIALGYIWMISRIDRLALPRMNWLLRVLIAGSIGAAAALISIPSLLAAAIGGLLYFVSGLLLKVFPPEVFERVPLLGRLHGG